MKTLAVLFLLIAGQCFSQVRWETDWATANARAKAEGKMIFADFCRPACTECRQENFIMNSASVAPTINGGFVPFQSDIDYSPVWKPFGRDLAGAALPLLVVIDPAKQAGIWVARSTGLRAGPALVSWLGKANGSSTATNAPPPTVTATIEPGKVYYLDATGQLRALLEANVAYKIVGATSTNYFPLPK